MKDSDESNRTGSHLPPPGRSGALPRRACNGSRARRTKWWSWRVPTTKRRTSVCAIRRSTGALPLSVALVERAGAGRRAQPRAGRGQRRRDRDHRRRRRAAPRLGRTHRCRVSEPTRAWAPSADVTGCTRKAACWTASGRGRARSRASGKIIGNHHLGVGPAPRSRYAQGRQHELPARGRRHAPLRCAPARRGRAGP